MITTRKHLHVTMAVRIFTKAAESQHSQTREEEDVCAPSGEVILAMLSQLYGRVTYSDYEFRQPFFWLEACFGPIEDAEVALEDLGESEELMEMALSQYLSGNDLVIDGLGVRYVT